MKSGFGWGWSVTTAFLGSVFWLLMAHDNPAAKTLDLLCVALLSAQPVALIVGGVAALLVYFGRP